MLNEGGRSISEVQGDEGEEEVNGENELLNEDVTREEVKQALDILKRKAAPGSDRLMAEMVCSGVLVDFWYSLFSWFWKNGMALSEWQRSTAVPIPKRSRSGVWKTEDFRGISLLPVAYKAMCSIAQYRLVHVVEERKLVAEEQGGFRKGRGCRDQLMTLVLLRQVKAMTKTIFLGVGRLHPLVSLQFELNMLPMKWVAMKRRIEFWVQIMRMTDGKLLKVVMLEALEVGCKGRWVKELQQSLVRFRWKVLDAEA